MNAILLVGGEGTRLRPLTLTQPKALLPVFNKPFMMYQLDLLKEAGVKNVMLAAGRFVRRWERSIRKLSTPKLRIHFAYEPHPLGTAGAIRFAYDNLKKNRLLADGPVLVFNGDIFFDFDVKKFAAFHKQKKSDGTILLTKVEDPTRFGVVSLTQSNQIRQFIEKPKDKSFGRLINAGSYILEPEWIERIPRSKAVSIERESFPSSLRRGDRLFGFEMNGYWNDIGTPQTYLNAQVELANISNRWTSKDFFRKRSRPFSAGSQKKTKINGKAVLAASCQIGNNVVFEGVVCCGNNVILSDSVRLLNSLVMEGARIEEGAVIEGSIIGRFCRIGKFSQIGQGSVLGDRTTLPPYTRC